MKNTIVFILILLFAACAKDGEPGINGTNGKDGNANVESKNFSITPGEWQTFSAYEKYFNFSTSLINQGIIDSGLVSVTWEKSGVQVPLPFSEFNGVTTTTLTFSYGLNNLQIDLYSNDVLNIPATTYNFKVTIASGHLRMKKNTTFDAPQ